MSNAKGRPSEGRPQQNPSSTDIVTPAVRLAMKVFPARNSVVLDAMKRARLEAQHNRRIVLAHKDLAALLVTVFGYDRPEQWNGYIPPKFYSACEVWRRNDAPCRPFLLGLVAEAAARGTR